MFVTVERFSAETKAEQMVQLVEQRLSASGATVQHREERDGCHWLAATAADPTVGEMDLRYRVETRRCDTLSELITTVATCTRQQRTYVGEALDAMLESVSVVSRE